MRKKIFALCALLCVIFSSAAFGSVAIDENNFPDYWFRLYVQLFFDDGDNELSDEEISGVVQIIIDNSQIQSLKGIEHFTNLMLLSCSGNELTELDLSQNKNLMGLDCRNNKLTALDVSENLDLMELYCAENKIAALDVSNNLSLSSLAIYSTDITELDVSNNIFLGVLFCDHTNISNLDLSNNIYLTSLSVPNTKITALDLTNNTELIGLSCENDALTALDVSSCPKLELLQCNNNLLETLNLENNPALVILSCDDNNLTTLDLSKNPMLEKLYCRNNELTSLNVRENNLLTFLACSNNKLSELDVSNNIFLERLSFYSNDISAIDLKNNTALTLIYAMYNELTELDVSNNIHLTDLGLDANNISALDVSKNSELKMLSVQNMNLSTLDISHNPELQALYCQHNNISALDVSHNTELLNLSAPYLNLSALDVSNCTKLQELYCSDNQLQTLTIGEKPALSVINCSYNQLTAINVSGCPALENFSCMYNKLNAVDVSANTLLVEFRCSSNDLSALNVSNNTALELLQCTNNNLTALDLTSNTKLKDLRFFRNNISTLDVSNCTELTNLYCMRNNLSELNVNSNTKLLELSCSYNQITDLDVSNNSALTYLNCYDNKISALNLRSNANLTRFFCNNNEISALDFSNNTEILEIWCWNNGLVSLNVSGCSKLHTLFCMNNKLTALDVSSNTGLKTFDCSHNLIDSLNVSSNTELTTLYCSDNNLSALNIENNKKITSLSCYSNDLSVLDVDNCENLTQLDCSSNNLTSLNLHNAPSLTLLYCWNNQLTELDLSRNSLLRNLICALNELTELNVSNNLQLAYLGCSFNKLQSLNLGNNSSLFQVFCSDNELSELDISHNPNILVLQCGNNNISSLNTDNNPDLMVLYCYGNLLRALDVTKNTELIQISCSNNDLTELDINKNPKLLRLECSGNYLANLDTGNNTELKIIYTAATTIRDFDISENISLVSLDVRSSDLTAINLSRNTELKYFTADGNSTLSVLYITSSNNDAYPYQTDMREYVGNNTEKISSVRAYDRTGAEIDCDFSGGIAKFSASPVRVVYSYDTGYTGQAQNIARNVDFTVSVPTRSFIYLPKVEPVLVDYETASRDDRFTTDDNDDIVRVSYAVNVVDRVTRNDNSSGIIETPTIYQSDNWTTNITISQGLLNAVTSAFDGVSDADVHNFADIITSTNWTINNSDLEIISAMGEKFLFTLPAAYAENSGVYVLFATLGNDAVPGEKLSGYNLHNSIYPAESLQIIFMDENFNVIDYVPDNRRVYIAVKFSAGDYSAGVVTSNGGGTSNSENDFDAVIEAFTPSNEVLSEISRTLGTEIKFLQDANIADPQNTIPENVTSYAQNDRHEIICAMNTITTNESGAYVFKIKLSEKTLGEILNERAKIYAYADGEISGCEIFSLSGENMNTFTENEFLSVANLDANTATSFYLAKAIAAETSSVGGSGGGCNSGVGFMAAVICAALMTKLFRRKIFVMILFFALCLTAHADYTLPTSFDVYTPSGNFDTSFSLTTELIENFAANLGVSADKIHAYSEISAGTWEISPVDIYNLARNGEYGAVILPLTQSGTGENFYVISCTFGEEIEAGELISVQGFSVDTNTRKTVYDSSRGYAFASFVALDENFNRVDAVPEGKKIYLAVSFTPEYVNTGIVTVVRGRYVEEEDPLIRLDPEIAQRIADELKISVDELKYLSRAYISDPIDPTPAMQEAVREENREIIGGINTVSADEDGWYVFRVRLSDELWEQVQGKEISGDLKIYGLADTESEINTSFILGLLNTWEVFTLTGHKMERFGLREFLMVGFLNSGQPICLFVARMILAFLTGGLTGCNAGVGFGILICGVLFVKFMRKR